MKVQDNYAVWAVEVIYINHNMDLKWVPKKCFGKRKDARQYAKKLRDQGFKLCPTNMQTRIKKYVLDV